VPINFHRRRPTRIPGSTHVHAWTVQKYAYAGPGKPHEIRLGSRSRSIPVSVETGYCVGKSKPSISRVSVEETDSAVTITAYLHKPGYVDRGYVCAGVGYEPVRRAHLDQPLGDRRLLDGAFTPPRPVPAHRR